MRSTGSPYLNKKWTDAGRHRAFRLAEMEALGGQRFTTIPEGP